MSNPQGKWSVYKLDLPTHTSEIIRGLPDAFDELEVAPDRESFLYKMKEVNSAKDEQVALLRMPFRGGVAVRVPGPKGNFSYRCARGTPKCVLMENIYEKCVFSVLDPIKGKGAELREVEEQVPASVWRLSPDGQYVAYIPTTSPDRIEVLSLGGSAKAEIQVKDAWLRQLTWSNDNKHLYVSAIFLQKNNQILRVGGTDKQRTLMEAPYSEFLNIYGVSPDERHIIYSSQSSDSNLFLLENF